MPQRVDHEVRPVVERAQQRRRGERRVDHQRETVAVRNLCVALDVRDVERRVPDGFDEHEAGLLGYCGLHRGEVVDRREVDLDADVGEDRVELAECSAVEVGRCDYFVSGPRDVGDREVDRRRAGGECLRGRSALERGDALGEDVVSRVHQPGVYVAELAQSEEVRAVLGIPEVVGGRAVHRHGARTRGGVAVRGLSRVHGQGLDVVFSVAHVAAPLLSVVDGDILTRRERARIIERRCQST